MHQHSQTTHPILTIDDPKFKLFSLVNSLLFLVVLHKQHTLKIKQLNIEKNYKLILESVINEAKTTSSAIKSIQSGNEFELAAYLKKLEDERREQERLEMELQYNMTLMQHERSKEEVKRMNADVKKRDFRRKLDKNKKKNDK